MTDFKATKDGTSSITNASSQRTSQVEIGREIHRLEGELHRTRLELAKTHQELSVAYHIRDFLGGRLERVWRSWAWRCSAPLRAVIAGLGFHRVGIEQLIPLMQARRLPDGNWFGENAPKFLVPIFPTRRWVRIRAKMECSVASHMYLYLDTGHSFNSNEVRDLGLVAGDAVVDRFLFLPATAHLLRFDPIWNGDVTIKEFSFEPVSRARMYLLALAKNIRSLSGAHGRRPSLSVGLGLLLRGHWKTFLQQLHANAQDAAIVISLRSEYPRWCKMHALTESDRRSMGEKMAQWKDPPKISVILPVYNVPEHYLRRCLDSVCRQIYPHWELCIADDASTNPDVQKVLSEYAARDPRIKVERRSVNGNISAASNTALEMATGRYIALLDHDDELAEHALYKMAEAIVRNPSLDMIYSDEDKLSADGERGDPFFKPDWSPELFLSCMYTCHLGVFRASLIREIGGWRSEFDGAQDYDLVLRLLEQDPRIHHIPDVLYHWRAHSDSTASSVQVKPKAHIAGQQAIQEHLRRTGREAAVDEGPAPTFHRVRYSLLAEPLVSIIIPSACRNVGSEDAPAWLALQCVQSILQTSTYQNIEIIVLDHQNMPMQLEQRLSQLGVRRVTYDFAFNWSKVNNHGAAAAKGEILVFLNDDIAVITPDWIERMLGYAQWPEIGAVGPKLLFEDNSLQHTGVFIPGGCPSHPFYKFPFDHPGYFSSNQLHRNWSAVTGACLMTRASVFRRVGGFDEQFPLNYNDVEYGLRLVRRGLRIVYTPDAELYHLESKTRKPSVSSEELAAIQKIWGQSFRWDPFYNPNLFPSSDHSDFRLNITQPIPIEDGATIYSQKRPEDVPRDRPIDREKWLARRQKISQQYLVGYGIEIGALHQPLWTSDRAHVRYVDRYPVEQLREQHPELQNDNFVNVDIIDDGEKLATIKCCSLDFIICNHLLENSENPLGMLRSHLSKLRAGGILYYAVPDREWTSDIERALTPFSHLVDDDRLGPQRSRWRHYVDWSRNVNHRSEDEVEQEARHLMQANSSIRFHVWDAPGFHDFMSEAQAYLQDQFAVEQIVENEMEIIAILRKR